MKLLKKLLSFSPPQKADSPAVGEETNTGKKENFYISKYYETNLSYIKERFCVPKNNDVVIKEMVIQKNTRAFLVFYDGMVNGDLINEGVVAPLLALPLIAGKNITKEIKKRLIIHNQVKEAADFDSVTDDINFGSCGLFVDGEECAFSIDVRSWEHRGVDKPDIEQSIFGPQEAFCEMLRSNSALIRKIIKNEKLIAYGITVGRESRTKGVLMYLSDRADPSLVSEVLRRINGINTDYIFAIEDISLMLQNGRYPFINKILSTERPDRAARMITEGRCVLLLSGSPKALVFPTNAYELIHTPSDAYMRFPYANMTRFIRLFGIFLSVLAPGLYLAATLFHQEVVPTFMIFSISAARESVPFPSVVEMLLMDFSFELIREAGVRMPSVIGSTLGIVGGLILGQAAVSAKIVSPIMIIVIAITGIGSFATPDYSLGWQLKIMRIIFILLGAFMGFFGIAAGIFLYSVILGSLSSFGIPFLAPLCGGGRGSVKGSLFVSKNSSGETKRSFLFPGKYSPENHQGEKI